jgi:hypothetical protein
MKINKIIKNVARCTHCGDIIESTHVHDFKWCSCKTIAVDGGHSYLKRSFKNSPADFEDMSICEEIEMPDKPEPAYDMYDSLIPKKGEK